MVSVPWGIDGPVLVFLILAILAALILFAFLIAAFGLFFTTGSLRGPLALFKIRNFLAVMVGLAMGGVLHAGPHVIVAVGGSLVGFGPLPVTLFAHALGTLAGSLVAFLIATSNRSVFAFTMAAVFLAGGVVVAFLRPGLTWYNFLDLAIAYIPMAWIGTQIGRRILQERRGSEI